MESKIKELRGILKDSAAAQRAADPREIAMQHARVVQHRKDLEAEILDSLILLSEYPLVRGPSYNASRPASSDAAGFQTLVRLFQPSDYDDLIEERHVNGLCGYTLCARPHRDTGPGGEWTITRGGHIVKRRDVERWCSQACARRALYVKVQLSETAAWERAGIAEIRIDLLDEGRFDKADDVDAAAGMLANLQIEEQERRSRDAAAAALALERGDQPEGAGGKQRVQVSLKERETQMPDVENLRIGDGDDDHLLVEGHRVGLGESAYR
ncbi:putative RNA polymerase II subunit B1 CTD phosphatase RPAP2 [Beauveria bassiana]|uniref:RNA polymerase II subunit B1 CTD phosphatase RPAP2 homolog n=1 Tax=Beauveria bassiana TaxID=176275 RepID=A0A2N6P250_BEABA|nr:putative RNA polymerase II subunit B1 CTD phosphatase RPAP2 [Beauveria bassiana]